ncbi:hypothetical protein [Rhodohalobacter sulfatireducens]|uniref:Uncharacterized protein n=1 Tax=Rhodohalobacter sulfatireducens TaxID=2911366 RepID=A0ABS9KE38_9BACT|nr:hypothetical protein [Rhodohalobacter sulfatireducens]MCG2589072.1 hypothetical protein [Rhodohalobacter sulfatireducens]
MRKVLAAIRTATATYHDVDKAIADGYLEATPFVPGMGYHYVNGGLMDDVIDPYAPEALVYIHNPANDSKRRLVAVEYIYPGPTVENGFDISILNDVFPGIDGDEWHHVGGVGWTLHAWVWYPNPGGVFNATNSRIGDGS